jgi:ParB-like nuclease domain
LCRTFDEAGVIVAALRENGSWSLQNCEKNETMNINQFTSQVKTIPIEEISVNPDNPRGEFNTTKDPSFERLASSVKQMGVLVPIVVRSLGRTDGQTKYQLVDGERRYWAARSVGRTSVPAHVLSTDVSPVAIRKVMFHLHMTREQWGPWAQCMALSEIYPELDRGIRVSKKDEWVRKIHLETSTNLSTARDRIRVLSWPKHLKNRIAEFIEQHPNHDVYSYVLAIEASVIEPSLEAFPEFYSRPRTAKVNEVRSKLLNKTLEGIETGTISRREEIRSVDALFTPRLDKKNHRVARTIFETLVDQTGYLFEDARSEIAVKLPEIFAERPPKVGRLITQIESLSQALDKYDPVYLEHSAKRSAKRKELKDTLAKSLSTLIKTAQALLGKL